MRNTEYKLYTKPRIIRKILDQLTKEKIHDKIGII